MTSASPASARFLAALLCAGSLVPLAGCADTSLKVGLSTRSAIYANSLLERERGVRTLLTATPARVGTLPGFAPGAPQRGYSAFASDAVRVALYRRCPGSTVLSGPTTVGLAAQAGKSRELAALIRDYNDSGMLQAEALADFGKATGLDYLFACTFVAADVRDAARLSPLGLTMVRSSWTMGNLVLQLWHAPSGRVVWQSVGDCTEYAESVAAGPVSIHAVLAELAGAMVNDLVCGRSRTTFVHVLNQPARKEQEVGPDGEPLHGAPEEPEQPIPNDPDAYAPADKPVIEPEPAFRPGA